MKDMALCQSRVRSVRLVRGGNYRHLCNGQAVRGVASRPDSGCGVVPCTRLGVLTSKAGMSFAFLGIMLATPPSIKDSDCGRRRLCRWLAVGMRLGTLQRRGHQAGGLKSGSKLPPPTPNERVATAG